MRFLLLLFQSFYRDVVANANPLLIFIFHVRTTIIHWLKSNIGDFFICKHDMGPKTTEDPEILKHWGQM